MKTVLAIAATTVSLATLYPVWSEAGLDAARVPSVPPGAFALADASISAGHREPVARAVTLAPSALTEVVQKSCAATCHSDRRKSGDLSLATYDVAKATAAPDVSEKIILKLRAGMMPPPGSRRPAGDTLTQVADALERAMDLRYAAQPDPGTKTFQRLNIAEYERSVRDLLTLEVKADKWLPLDTKSANFDNIADVQMPSATTLDAYLDAASEIARLAIGDPKASVTTTTYKLPRLASQWVRAEGAPMGTRGGMSAVHTFPADGEYVFEVTLHAIPTGQLYGSDAPFDEKVEISVDGERVALLDIDRWMSQADPDGMDIKTPAIPVRAGAHRIAAAFTQTFDGPVNDNIKQIGHSIADTQIGSEQGITNIAHLSSMAVRGPYNPTGVSETESRRRIFTCRPTSPAEARPCAEKIIGQLATRAYRRALTPKDLQSLIGFYDEGAKEGGFELGVRTALEAMLASPHFVFRFEELPAGARPGARYAIGDTDLATRLSFFLWGTPPDEKLLAAARTGTLSTPAGLAAQTKRMLADPRSEALATRFAAQWLRLQDIDKVHPDALQFPDFHEQLATAMKEETQRFFSYIVRENRSVLDLLSADYTFVNEALARHYGIPGVTGDEFRKVTYPDDRRRGLFGHASVLTLTSHANRTSPVLRGKWVMEVIMGTPPPAPPPNVPDLEKTGDAKEGRLITTRERMEIHRANPACRSCHNFIDPIGLALDNFDVTGRWRIREFDAPLDTKGTFYDGTEIATPAQLQQVLLKRPAPIVRNFTANLMAYATGRRIEYFDQPAIRKIVREAETGGYRFGDFVLGVVSSDAFRMKRAPVAADAPNSSH
ncbi:MAG: DUF1592 domain-containing protein [Gemmatimonadetes bacterium]|nr:DUF1592 domain-containing protein [Gemmatimonadota bacterium]